MPSWGVSVTGMCGVCLHSPEATASWSHILGLSGIGPSAYKLDALGHQGCGGVRTTLTPKEGHFLVLSLAYWAFSSSSLSLCDFLF